MKNHLCKSLLGLTLLLTVSCATDTESLDETDLTSSSSSKLSFSDLTLTSVANDTGVGFYIRNVNSGKFLDVEAYDKTNGGNIHQWSFTGNANQKWYLETHQSRTRIRSAHSGRVLDVEGRSQNNGANIQQWGAGNGANQLWRLSTTTGTYTYLIESANAGGFLEVGAWSKNNGGNVQQWDKTGSNGGTNQRWQFYRE